MAIPQSYKALKEDLSWETQVSDNVMWISL